MAAARRGLGELGRVFSTQGGQLCPACERPQAGCICARLAEERRLAEPTGPARVGRETKGRKGAGVTVVTGLRLEDPELRELAKELKRRCGTGGTLKGGVIELQGEHRDAVVAALEARGLDVRRVGG
jgi:translation initiation factor 1